MQRKGSRFGYFVEHAGQAAAGDVAQAVNLDACFHKLQDHLGNGGGIALDGALEPQLFAVGVNLEGPGLGDRPGPLGFPPAVVLVGPLGEEIMFRGFLYRGLVRVHDRPIWGILTISILWTALHVQYDWSGLLQVFLIGLLFGWVRWRSGSTTLTFVLHALMNLESAVETVIKVGWVI